MSVKIVTVTNRKGGVGKTTLAVHAAFGLSMFHGVRVGLIDTDPQGNVSDMIGVAPTDGLYNLLVNGAALDTQVLECGGVAVLPSAYKTQLIADHLDPTAIFAFADLCDQFAEQRGLDVVLVDTPPTLNAFDAQVYMAATDFVYPTEAEKLSIEGLTDAVQQMKRISAQRVRMGLSPSRIMAVQPNKLRPSTRLHRINLDSLRETLGEAVWEPMQLLTGWPEAVNAGQPVWSLDNAGRAVSEAVAFVERVAKALGVLHG